MKTCQPNPSMTALNGTHPTFSNKIYTRATDVSLDVLDDSVYTFGAKS